MYKIKQNDSPALNNKYTDPITSIELLVTNTCLPSFVTFADQKNTNHGAAGFPEGTTSIVRGVGIQQMGAVGGALCSVGFCLHRVVFLYEVGVPKG